MTATLAPISPILPVTAGKDERHRLVRFAAWLSAHNMPWYSPDLCAYRDHLLIGYKPSTVSAHLSTIRARYRRLCRNRDLFYEIAAPVTGDPVERKTFVDELIQRIENAIHPDAAPVKTVTSQDQADSSHLRLTADQVSDLLAQPGVDSLKGLRDTAIIALMLCTGLREAELSGLDLPDLRQRLGGELALHVREGKGRKERLIPYGGLEWVLVLVDAWLKHGRVISSPAFRAMGKGGRVKQNRIGVRSVQRVLEAYPIVIEGQLTQVRPHDLRRTYARRLYEAGVDLVAIQQNLGHASQETTLGYIGSLDGSSRKPPGVYRFDLSVLNGIVNGR